MRTTIIESDDEPRWRDFIDSHPCALPFHQPEWTTAVSQAFGYKQRFHVLEDATAKIHAAWPAMIVRSRVTGSRLLCMPFCHRAGPLLDTEEQALSLLGSLNDDCHALRIASLEAREWPDHIPIPQDLNVTPASSTHILDLTPGPEQLLAAVSSDMRYSIRRAERNGVTVRISRDVYDLEGFYRLYKEQRRRQELLPQPKSFVQALFRNFLATGKGFMAVAEHEGKPVCVLLNIGHRAVMMGLDSGTDPSARQLRATALAVWRSIEAACELGYERFDFGRSPASSSGLQRFKSEWGAQEVPLRKFWLGREIAVNTGNPDPRKKAIISLLSKSAPDRLMTGLSSRIYRHLA